MKEQPIKAYKGFNKDMTCRGYQYEVGKEYEQEGPVKACDKGFHACENPLDVFGYYPPSDGNGLRRYCEVEQSGEIDKSEDKICSSKLHICAEIGLNGLIKAGVKFILDKVTQENKATNTGDQSAATVEGQESIAIVTGRDSKAKGALGCWLVLTERDDEWRILGVKAVKVDGETVRSGKWYALKSGEVVEVKDSDDD